jgi:hydroxyacylglutathione hydrolase
MSLFLKQFELGPMQNFVYLVGDTETKEAAVVDPAWNASQILKEVSEAGFRLTHVVLTHGHFDHINGVEEIIEVTDATICGQKSEIEHFIPEGGGGLVIPRSVLSKVVTGPALTLGQVTIDLLPTPGHTPGSQCLFVRSPGQSAPALITGDTLFMGTCGRCDFPYSDPEQLYNSLRRLKELPEETVIYPGHDYGATPSNTLSREKKSNPFLLVSQLDQFLSLVGR